MPLLPTRVHVRSIGDGTVSNLGTISVGENSSLDVSNGSLTEGAGSAMDVEGQLAVGASGSCSIGGSVTLDGTDNGIDNPGDSVLVSTPITAATPPSTQVVAAVRQASATESDIFEEIEVLAEGAANQLPSNVAVIQGAQKLASWAKGASNIALTTKYAADITLLQNAWNNNDPDAFAAAYDKFTEDVNSDIYGLATGALFGYATAATAVADAGASIAAVPLATLFGKLLGSTSYEAYYKKFLEQNVINDGMNLFFALKNHQSSAVGGSGGTLSDQGSVTVSATGNLCDQDAITVGAGATFVVSGTLTEGIGGNLDNSGTVTLEPNSTLTDQGTVTVETGGLMNVYGTLFIEPGTTYIPLGTVTVEPGGALEVLSVNPVNITYGTLLVVTQLGSGTATVNGQTVAGNFTYTSTEEGALLSAGNGQSEQVTFTPSDATDYFTVTATVTVNVGQATPTVIAANESTTYDGSPQAYPVTASDVYVTGVSNGNDQTPSGTFSYSYASATYGPTSTPPTDAGMYTVTATFTTADPNYTTGSTTATWTINAATPTITWSNPASITYGTPLGASQLDATANVLGAFTYTSAAGVVLSAGNNQTLSVLFTPTDTNDYRAASATATINVAQATPTVSVNPVNITYGTTLADGQLGGTAAWVVGGNSVMVAGTFTYTSAARTVLGAGNSQSESVTFTPNDVTDYTTASSTATVNVARAATSTLVVSSANPSVYGQALTFTATVTNTSNGSTAVPTGTVQFVVDGSNFGPPVAVGGIGLAVSLPDTFLSGASHTVKAVFTNIDGNFLGNNSTNLTQTVQTVAVEPDPSNPTLTDLFIGSNGATSNDTILVNPAGSSNTGTTGITVQTTLNGVTVKTTYSQSFSTIYAFLQNGNDNVQLASTLSINAVVSAGNV